MHLVERTEITRAVREDARSTIWSPRCRQLLLRDTVCRLGIAGGIGGDVSAISCEAPSSLAASRAGSLALWRRVAEGFQFGRASLVAFITESSRWLDVIGEVGVQMPDILCAWPWDCPRAAFERLRVAVSTTGLSFGVRFLLNLSPCSLTDCGVCYSASLSDLVFFPSKCFGETSYRSL